MTDMDAPPPLALTRTRSDGGIPIYSGNDITITQKSAMNFDGQVPAANRLWFGPTTFELINDTWTISAFLNSGAEGQTYLVTRKSSGQKLAAKFCSIETSQEIDLVKKLPRQLVVHPNFISYEFMVLNVGAQFPHAKHIIFMEHIPNGELFDLLASGEPSVAGKPVSEGTSRRFLHDIIQGMAECYKFGVTHRDLKPENLLLNEEGRIVIIDMGHAKRGASAPRGGSDELGAPAPMMPERTTTNNPYGTVAFNAPEVGAGGKYDCEFSDVWSVGVIAFYLHGKLPAFTGGGGVGLWADIQGADNAKFWTNIEKCGYYPQFPPKLKLFINALWRKTPSERPSFENMSLAIGGDAATLEQFPGLQWLADPLNHVEEFLDELRRSRPDIELNTGGPVPGLRAWLKERNLVRHFAAINAWCISNGAVELAEVVESRETIAESISPMLTEEERFSFAA